MGYKDKNKQREYQRKWLAKRRLYAVACFGGKCKGCNSEDQLHFDHIDPRTKISHNIWSWSGERLKEELKKCQLLCKDCHTEKTMKENKLKPATHGSLQMYNKKGCRCEICLERKMRNWRALSPEERRRRRREKYLKTGH